MQLKGVTNVVISDNITSLSASMQLGFLQCLISHIVSVVANYIDAEARLTQKFGMPITSLEPIMLQRTSRDIVGTAIPPEHPQTPRASTSRRSSLQKRLSSGSSVVGLETSGSQRISVGAQSPGSSRSARDTSGLPNGSVPLLETGGLNWFVGRILLLHLTNSSSFLLMTWTAAICMQNGWYLFSQIF